MNKEALVGGILELSDWKSFFTHPEKLSEEVIEQIDLLVSLIDSDALDETKTEVLATQEAGNKTYGTEITLSEHRLSLEALLVWGKKSGAITTEEYRSLSDQVLSIID